MFTGIIRYFGVLKEFKNNRLTIEINHDRKVEIGDSIACNGVCLTVVDIRDNLYFFDLAEETILKTNLVKLKKDDLMNIEFAARFGDKIDGHIVNGHVYGLGVVHDIIKNDNGWIFVFQLEDGVFQYVDYKASISVDGISLTVSNLNVEKRLFEVNVLPFTFENTNLKIKKVGDLVNIEPDIFAVYALGILRRK